jgi:sirohydrochlorin cobaltochelatase
LPQDDQGEEAPVFTRDALLLIGHGSERLTDAARPLLAHAEVIRETGRFAEVKVGMLFGDPDVASVVARLTAPVVHVVPFFFNEGYFTRIVIPNLLLPLASASRVLRFCPPVGSHEAMASLIESRALRHCETHGIDPKSLSVLLVGHGSAQSPGRARTLLRDAAILDNGSRFGWVRVAYLEEPPFVADALANARGHIVAIIACLANEGKHATHDLPCLIAAERDERGTHWPPVHDLGSIGADEAMPQLIMDQVMAARPV